MPMNNLSPVSESKKNRKRVARGIGSGWGKTAGRGQKGQKSRSGGGTPPWFEGGQNPLYRRVPKRGFTNIFAKNVAIINMGYLATYLKNKNYSESDITLQNLIKLGVFNKKMEKLKLLGEIKKDEENNLDFLKDKTIKLNGASKKGKELAEKSGLKIELIN